jgi:hypothetical protein
MGPLKIWSDQAWFDQWSMQDIARAKCFAMSFLIGSLEDFLKQESRPVLTFGYSTETGMRRCSAERNFSEAFALLGRPMR